MSWFGTIEESQNSLRAQIRITSRLDSIFANPDVAKEVFFVAKATTFQNPLTLETFPAEISVAAFSLDKGLLDCFWTLIHHEDMQKGVPPGTGNAVKEMSEETGLPIPGNPVYSAFALCANEYVLTKLAKFVYKYAPDVPSKRAPHVFAMKSDIDQVNSSLKWLLKNAQVSLPDTEVEQEFLDNLHIVDLASLLYRCAEHAHSIRKEYNPHMLQFRLPPLAENILRSPKYNYKLDLACAYHTNDEKTTQLKVDKCTKNIVLRQVFLFLDEVVYALGIERKPGHAVEYALHTLQLDSRKDPEL